MSRRTEVGSKTRGVDRVMGALMVSVLGSLLIWGCAPKDHQHPEYAVAGHAHPTVDLPAEAFALVDTIENLALQAVWNERDWLAIMECLDTAEESLGAPVEGPVGDPPGANLPHKYSAIRWMVNKIEILAVKKLAADPASWTNIETALQQGQQCLAPLAEWGPGDACPWPQSPEGGPCLPDNKGP